MVNEDESKRKLVEFLWIEINRAIVNSMEVKSCIKILKNLDLLDHIEDYNLVLDVKALINLIQKNDEKDEDAPSLQKTEEPKLSANKATGKSHEDKPLARKNRQKIDGEALTMNEVLFQKHLEKNFNEGVWLKKAGIRFLN